MAILFCDGFDKYGPVGQIIPTVASLLTAGEWTSCNLNGPPLIVAGLSGTGLAFSLGNSSSSQSLVKTLSASYSRLIGGLRFSGTLVQNLGAPAFQINGTACCALTINSAGTISLRTGAVTGTAIASGGSFSANSTHYLEWDITFAASGAYQVWLDGVSIFSGTGNTGNGNTTANQIAIGANTSFANAGLTLDDLYLFDNTGATCNAVLLNNPLVETEFPSADTATKQWTNGASIIGTDNAVTSATAASGTGVRVRPYTASANMTLQSISLVPAATNGTVQFRPVVYVSANTGAALLATGPTVVGVTSGTTLTMPLTTPLALTGGTSYAIGYMCDTSLNLQNSDSLSQASSGVATFGSGAPSTLPTMTTGQNSMQCWGNCTGSASDYVSINLNPAIDDISYLFSSTVGQQEMQSFPALSSNPASIACVTYKARIKRSDAGSRAAEVHCVSGSADSAGSTAGGVTPGSSYGWIGNYLPLDPNTGVAWTGTGANAATGGVKVFS